MKALRLRLAILSISFLSLSVGALSQAPVLTSMSPTALAPGMQVTLTGSGFGSTVGGLGYVALPYWGAASIVSWSDTQIVFTVPPQFVPGNLYVSQNGLNSNTLSYTVVPPVLTSMSPTALAPGMQVTLTGSGFGATAGGQGYVGLPYWGGPSIVSWSDTQIVFTAPPQFVPGNVSVTQNGANSNTLSYTVVPPVLTSMSPTALAPGMQVTLTGSGFGAAAGGLGFVELPLQNAPIVSWSNTQIVFTVPSGTAAGTLFVQQNEVNSNTLSFTVGNVSPTISSLNPSSAPAGTAIQIVGQNLSASNQQPVVSLGNLQVTGNQVSSSDPTSIYFIVPQGATSGSVSVQVGGQTSNAVPFTLLTLPQIYSLAPVEIPPSATLTISGINFGATGGNGNSLLIDGQTTTPSSWSSTQITTQAPSSAGSHTVQVISGSNQSAALQFTVLSYGAISGTVTSNGVPISGAVVQGVAGQSTITDGGGNFSFAVVPVGTYPIGAVAAGYIPSTIGQIGVSAGTTTNVPIQLFLPNPTAISIVPNGPTTTIGAAQNLSLVDQNGMPVTGATWSVDDPSVAFLDSTENSVTGVLVGTTTLRASWQGLQTSTAVTVVGGTSNILWSSQLTGLAAGIPVLRLAKTGTGPDLVYTDGSNVYGVSYDNGLMWQQAVSGYFPTWAADENGDFFVPGTGNGNDITKFFGTNGMPEWSRPYPFSGTQSFAVDAQGNLFVSSADQSSNWSLQKFDSSTGQNVLSVPLPGPTNQVFIQSDGSVQVQCVQFLGLPGGALHLITLSGTTVTDQVLDSSVYAWTATSGTVVRAGANLPDGSGGKVNIWEEYVFKEIFDAQGVLEATATQPSSKVLFYDSTTGITSQLSAVQDPGNFVLGNTGLLYFNGSQFGCSTNEVGYCGDVLAAMNLVTGTEAWQINLDSSGAGGWSGQAYGLPVAATGDGGIMTAAYPQTSQVSVQGAARVDANGNVSVDSDISPYVTAPLGYVNSLFYLGGPEGTLWASNSSGSLISDLADRDFTSGDVISDWGEPTGGGNGEHAAKSTHFIDFDSKYHCGGFDGNVTPSVLVVPVNGTNQVILQVEGVAWQNLTLVSDTASVTVSPTAPTGKKTPLTVTASSTPTLARIKVMNADGSHVATLRVAVKAPGAAVAVDLYPLIEANENLVPTVPATIATDVLNEYQIVFGKHANIPFTVNLMSPISVAYDLNGDGMLAYTGQNFSTNNEALTVSSYLNTHGNPSHKYVAYVNKIVPLSPTDSVEGFGSDPLAFVQNQTNSGQPYVTAHETGHIFGLHHNLSDEEDVMTKPDPGTGPCRLHVDEWNQLNPTGDQAHPKQWELAPPQHPEDD